MSFPKIVYNPGGGEVTLTFLRPARMLPGYHREAVRHDNVSTAGVRESVLERVDEFLTFEMPYVSTGADLTAWAAFMNYALAGGQFQFYPDASQVDYTLYWLEDTTWLAAYKAAGEFSFAVKFRRVVA